LEVSYVIRFNLILIQTFITIIHINSCTLYIKYMKQDVWTLENHLQNHILKKVGYIIRLVFSISIVFTSKTLKLLCGCNNIDYLLTICNECLMFRSFWVRWNLYNVFLWVARGWSIYCLLYKFNCKILHFLN